MKKIAIIGAGASGLTAAIAAAGSGAQVCLFEKNDIAGKKLLATGNGKCNFLNVDQDIKHFHSQTLGIMQQILEQVSYDEILSFFEGIGILPYSRGGYLYPMSGQARSIHTALIETAKSLGVSFFCNREVISVKHHERHFEIICADGNKHVSDALILTVGTRAGTKLKTNPASDFAKSFGHTLITYAPALSALKSDAPICRYWHGVRIRAELKLFIDGSEAAGDSGELMLTDYGISGIPAFQVSYLVPGAIAKKKEVFALVDWLFELEKDRLMSFIDELSYRFPKHGPEDLLKGLLPLKLSKSLVIEAVKRGGELFNVPAHELIWSKMNSKQRETIINCIKNFKIPITGVNDFSKAQVSSGGVPLEEIVPSSCESRLVRELYLAGELLDVNGDCGGYNLQWAWITGLLAGRAAARENKL